MNTAVNFILESGVSLALLSLIYILFLRRETFFRLNRLFLLASLAFSIFLPFLKFRIYEAQAVMLSEITVTPYRNVLEAVTIYGQDFSQNLAHSISSSKIIIAIYLLGIVFFLGRFIYRLAQIALLINRNPVEVSNGVKYVGLSMEFSPFSFLNYVFIDPAKQNQPGYDKMIVHELEHIKQGHTFDVLILEILTILQWFNPFMWMLKRVVRENHEYLADRAVLKNGTSAASYKYLLINQAVGFQPEMANNFNSSLIKKRIKMISKIQSSKIANLKYVIGVLTVLALVAVFACEQKESATMEAPAEMESVKLTFSDEGIQVDGSAEDILKLKSMMHNTGFSFETKENGSLVMIKNQRAEVKKLEDGDPIFFIVEEMPEFPDGEKALREFIAQHINYPEEAQENKIEGKVYVSFVVNKNGEVANAEIARGVAPSLDQEALRVINELPNWKPGKQRGEAVNVQYTVPINFVLK